MSEQAGRIEVHLQTLQNILGEHASLVTNWGQIVDVSIRQFMSTTFQRAGFNMHPDRYGKSDGRVYQVTYADGKSAFIIDGKDGRNPYAGTHVEFGGLDLRKPLHVIFLFDGQGKVREIIPEESDTTYEGQDADPHIVYGAVLRVLGTEVTVEDK